MPPTEVECWSGRRSDTSDPYRREARKTSPGPVTVRERSWQILPARARSRRAVCRRLECRGTPLGCGWLTSSAVGSGSVGGSPAGGRFLVPGRGSCGLGLAARAGDYRSTSVAGAWCPPPSFRFCAGLCPNVPECARGHVEPSVPVCFMTRARSRSTSAPPRRGTGTGTLRRGPQSEPESRPALLPRRSAVMESSGSAVLSLSDGRRLQVVLGSDWRLGVPVPLGGRRRGGMECPAPAASRALPRSSVPPPSTALPAGRTGGWVSASG
jgi:hypothetical protein